MTQNTLQDVQIIASTLRPAFILELRLHLRQTSLGAFLLAVDAGREGTGASTRSMKSAQASAQVSEAPVGDTPVLPSSSGSS